MIEILRVTIYIILYVNSMDGPFLFEGVFTILS